MKSRVGRFVLAQTIWVIAMFFFVYQYDSLRDAAATVSFLFLLLVFVLPLVLNHLLWFNEEIAQMARSREERAIEPEPAALPADKLKRAPQRDWEITSLEEFAARQQRSQSEPVSNDQAENQERPRSTT